MFVCAEFIGWDGDLPTKGQVRQGPRRKGDEPPVQVGECARFGVEVGGFRGDDAGEAAKGLDPKLRGAAGGGARRGKINDAGVA